MLVILACLAGALAAPPLDPLVVQAEDAWAVDDLDRSNLLLEQRLAQDPNDVEAVWRKARNVYSHGELLAQQGASAEERIAMYVEMEGEMAGALKVAPDHGGVLHWTATMMGRRATAQGVFQSLFLADDLERTWLKASNSSYRYRSAENTSSLPGDVYFALGQFYRLCPDWMLVKMLTGTRGDIDKSISWLRKGVKDSPTRPEVQKELGVSLLCKAERHDDNAAAQEGREWLLRATKLPVQKATDEVDRLQIPVILQRPKEACGYSRDGWQDVSRDAYEKGKGD
jgi:hypothetical protein